MIYSNAAKKACLVIKALMSVLLFVTHHYTHTIKAFAWRWVRGSFSALKIENKKIHKPTVFCTHTCVFAARQRQIVEPVSAGRGLRLEGRKEVCYGIIRAHGIFNIVFSGWQWQTAQHVGTFWQRVREVLFGLI